MFNALTGTIGTYVARATTALAANKGELLIAGGIGCFSIACFEFHKSGMKVDRILEEGKKTVEKIESVKIDPAYVDQYSEEDAAKDLRMAKIETGKELVKNYIFPVAFAAAGTIMILKGMHVIEIKLADTSAALALALKANDTMYNRIKEKYGEDAANAIKYGYEEKTYEETTMNEDGTITTETITENELIDDSLGSPYAIFVPENHPAFEKDRDYLLNIIGIEEWNANNKCRQVMSLPWYHVLNELHVMDLLNDWQKAASMVVGWTYDPEFNSDEDPSRDNHIKITCISATRPSTSEPGVPVKYQRGYILDFNVEGNIQEKLAEKAVKNVKRQEARKVKKLNVIR